MRVPTGNYELFLERNENEEVRKQSRIRKLRNMARAAMLPFEIILNEEGASEPAREEHGL